MLLGGFGAKRQENKGEAGVAPSPLRQEHVAVTMIYAAWRFWSEATGKQGRGRSRAEPAATGARRSNHDLCCLAVLERSDKKTRARPESRRARCDRSTSQ